MIVKGPWKLVYGPRLIKNGSPVTVKRNVWEKPRKRRTSCYQLIKAHSRVSSRVRVKYLRDQTHQQTVKWIVSYKQQRQLCLQWKQNSSCYRCKHRIRVKYKIKSRKEVELELKASMGRLQRHFMQETPTSTKIRLALSFLTKKLKVKTANKLNDWL